MFTSIACVACRACHSSCTFSSLWHTHTHTQTHMHARMHAHTHRDQETCLPAAGNRQQFALCWGSGLASRTKCWRVKVVKHQGTRSYAGNIIPLSGEEPLATKKTWCFFFSFECGLDKKKIARRRMASIFFWKLTCYDADSDFTVVHSKHLKERRQVIFVSHRKKGRCTRPDHFPLHKAAREGSVIESNMSCLRLAELLQHVNRRLCSSWTALELFELWTNSRKSDHKDSTAAHTNRSTQRLQSWMYFMWTPSITVQLYGDQRARKTGEKESVVSEARRRQKDRPLIDVDRQNSQRTRRCSSDHARCSQSFRRAIAKCVPRSATKRWRNFRWRWRFTRTGGLCSVLMVLGGGGGGGGGVRACQVNEKGLNFVFGNLSFISCRLTVPFVRTWNRAQNWGRQTGPMVENVSRQIDHRSLWSGRQKYFLVANGD